MVHILFQNFQKLLGISMWKLEFIEKVVEKLFNVILAYLLLQTIQEEKPLFIRYLTKKGFTEIIINRVLGIDSCESTVHSNLMYSPIQVLIRIIDFKVEIFVTSEIFADHTFTKSSNPFIKP